MWVDDALLGKSRLFFKGREGIVVINTRWYLNDR